MCSKLLSRLKYFFPHVQGIKEDKSASKIPITNSKLLKNFGLGFGFAVWILLLWDCHQRSAERETH